MQYHLTMTEQFVEKWMLLKYISWAKVIMKIIKATCVWWWDPALREQWRDKWPLSSDGIGIYPGKLCLICFHLSNKRIKRWMYKTKWPLSSDGIGIYTAEKLCLICFHLSNNRTKRWMYKTKWPLSSDGIGIYPGKLCLISFSHVKQK